MYMQRRSQLDKSEKWAYFVSWCIVGSPSFPLARPGSQTRGKKGPLVVYEKWDRKQTELGGGEGGWGREEEGVI